MAEPIKQDKKTDDVIDANSNASFQSTMTRGNSTQPLEREKYAPAPMLENPISLPDPDDALIPTSTLDMPTLDLRGTKDSASSLLQQAQAAGSTQTFDGKFATQDPQTRKITQKHDVNELNFVDKLKAAAEYEAARTGQEPNMLKTFAHAMGKDPTMKDNVAAQAVKQDVKQGVKDGAKGALQLFEAFAKGKSGGNWTTSLDKEMAQKAAEQQMEYASTEAQKGREFTSGENVAERTYQKGEKALDREVAKAEAEIGRAFTREENELIRNAAKTAAMDQRTFDEEQNRLARELQGKLAGEQNIEMRKRALTDFYSQTIANEYAYSRDKGKFFTSQDAVDLLNALSSVYGAANKKAEDQLAAEATEKAAITSTSAVVPATTTAVVPATTPATDPVIVIPTPPVEKVSPTYDPATNKYFFTDKNGKKTYVNKDGSAIKP